MKSSVLHRIANRISSVQFILPTVGVLVCLLVCTLQAASFPTSGGQQAATAVTPVQEKAVVQEEPVARQRTPREDAELRGDLLMVRKQYIEAIQAYEGILAKEPKNPILLNKIGVAYTHLSELDRAKRYYERAIKADKNYAEAYNNIGTVHYQRKKYRRAIEQYRKALGMYEASGQQRPGLAAVHSNLGYALFGAKKYEEAMTNIQRALELDPQVLERRGGMGGSLLQDRNVEERAFFYFFIAKSYASMNNAERCAHYLKRAFEEGYKGLPDVKKDPAFASVVKDPLVEEVLNLAVAAAPPAKKTE